MDELLYWIWLALRCGAGSESGTYLLAQLGTPEKIYNSDEKALSDITGISNELKGALLDKDLDLCKRILEYCRRTNISVMTADSGIYPERLRTIHAKPLVLYYKGKVPKIDDNVLVSVVGTRSCTDYGSSVAYKFGAELALGGTVVVSGMALGVDTMAARGALSVKGHTIAVLGCGLDTVYPPQNKELMEQIVLNGTVISEFAPGAEPAAKNFPIRNRIISGLSQATLVVEANMRSGSLITAGHAQAQGRQVFAVPGRIGESESAGTNDLIRRGAKIALSAKDILEEYELLYPHRIFTENIRGIRYSTVKPLKVAATDAKLDSAPPAYVKKKTLFSGKKPAPAPDTSFLTDREKAIYLLIREKMTPDEIRLSASSTGEGIETGELLGVLTTLEIYGLVRALPGGMYEKV